MLKSTINTREIEREITAAAENHFASYTRTSPVDVAYEHGQWWVQFYDTEDTMRQFSVIDVEQDGEEFFDFEEV